ncbi:MAG: hypothetical protein AAGE84_12875 [Cyanobacteria bacterium P01_G01_bin.39]
MVKLSDRDGDGDLDLDLLNFNRNGQVNVSSNNLYNSFTFDKAIALLLIKLNFSQLTTALRCLDLRLASQTACAERDRKLLKIH